MGLPAKTMELVALGAAIAGNCVPCLEWHFKKCIDLGVSKAELGQAIAMAKRVKQVPIDKIGEVADQLMEASAEAKETDDGLQISLRVNRD